VTSIAIVTPWRDHLELAGDYWKTVRQVDADEVIIVDDASSPPLAFGSLRTEASLGFCEASNAGLSFSQSDAVLFLNNDIADGDDGWLEQIREALEPDVLVGAEMRWDRHGDVDGNRLPYLGGWCLAGMRDDLVELGGFDEGLEPPGYYSDNLLCLEARAAGMTLRALTLGLHHKGGATTQPHNNPDVQRASSFNRDRYVARAREVLVTA